jgi:hypothetical protein
MHTWFLQGDWSSLTKVSVADFPYIVPLALLEVGRGEEALPVLRDLEGKVPTRRRHVVAAARALLEGRTRDSVDAMLAMVSPDFRDPEGRFYVARHVARHGDATQALSLLEGIVADGFSCYPVFDRDSWFDALRGRPAFTALLARCADRHADAVRAFDNLDGRSILATA